MSGDEPLSFDLIDRPWLPARTLDGRERELSLMEVFRQAHHLSGLAGDVPTQVFALTRLMLAVLHRAVGGPCDVAAWERLWRARTLPVGEVESYLSGHRARYDLFDPVTPFFQVAGLRTDKGETSELSKLIADVPNGLPFFTNRLGGRLSLSFAEAARWLVHCQAYDPSGIKSGAADDTRTKNGKGYPIGVAWSGQLGAVLPEGRTLRETLLLNLIPCGVGVIDRRHETDLPSWERAEAAVFHDESLPDRPPTGPVDLYTWQARRVRLFADGGRVTGVLICNGERITPQNKQTAEPHTAWRRSGAQEKKLGARTVYMPREHEPEKAVWRGLQSLLPGGVDRPQDSDAAAFLSPEILEWLAQAEEVIGDDYIVRLHTIGMVYGSQNSTTADIIDDVLSVHAVLLRHDAAHLARTAVRCVEASERAASALGKLARNLAAAAGSGKDEREAPRTRATELAYAELDTRFRAWLASLTADTDPESAESRWHHTAARAVRTLGQELVDAAPMTAWAGRVGDKRLINTPLAETWFHFELRKAVPMAYPQESVAIP
ncbi:type I-E CRISPR-associated protein Cse1/CasA [Actinosynnema sp. CS-041913]|uniref:type I-E CRISPR-associated protein Cse1/CasA n=1 Tax=Actinosynnema sp. CS-041913 TaxID=3239917 RepID=UPI003D8C2D1D